MSVFSPRRTLAVFIKEFQQMLRDRLTFAMAIGVPILQLVLFGYAINTDPKGLPTALVSYDSGPMARTLTAALQNTATSASWCRAPVNMRPRPCWRRARRSSWW